METASRQFPKSQDFRFATVSKKSRNDLETETETETVRSETETETETSKNLSRDVSRPRQCLETIQLCIVLALQGTLIEKSKNTVFWYASLAEVMLNILLLHQESLQIFQEKFCPWLEIVDQNQRYEHPFVMEQLWIPVETME